MRLTARHVILGLGLAVGMAAAGGSTALTGEPPGLLSLGGRHVKWGAPVYGAEAEITYELLDEPRAIAGARNCAEMLPLDPLLARAGIGAAEFAREVEAALALWSERAQLRFRRVEDPDRADILIGAQQGSRGVAFANVSQDRESAAVIAPIEQAAICLDPAERWELPGDGNPGTYNLRRVLVHEIGHAIGLDHYGPTGGIMGFAYVEPSDGRAGIRLTDMDVAAVTLLYGARGTPPAPAIVAARSGDASRSCSALVSDPSATADCALHKEAGAATDALGPR